MNYAFLNVSRLVALGLIWLCASSVGAVTTATGPYYATPAWDQKLQCDTQATCPRFIVLSNWNNAAVLDRETGLVWEQSPEAFTLHWVDAQADCLDKNVGGRHGWKLPGIQELRSLLDPASHTPALPAGHPFANVQSNFYWSATTLAANTARAWVTNFDDRTLGPDDKTNVNFIWCVRGGPGGDEQ